MEIKIKDKDNLIDATIEVVNGVMIVSPKEEKYEPKDGDVCYCNGLIYIFKTTIDLVHHKGIIVFHCLLHLNNSILVLDEDTGVGSIGEGERLATEEEKQKLFDKLKEEGYEFDFEKKKLVKLKWIPTLNETIFAPHFDSPKFITKQWLWEINASSAYHYEKGWVFKTEEECQSFCDKLNQAINQIKP